MIELKLYILYFSFIYFLSSTWQVKESLLTKDQARPVYIFQSTFHPRSPTPRREEGEGLLEFIVMQT